MRDKINRNQTGAVKASRAHNVGRCLHDAYSLSWCETVSTSVGHEEPTQPISDNIVPITKADANLSCACITTCTSPYEPVNYRPLFPLWVRQTCQKKSLPSSREVNETSKPMKSSIARRMDIKLGTWTVICIIFSKTASSRPSSTSKHAPWHFQNSVYKSTFRRRKNICLYGLVLAIRRQGQNDETIRGSPKIHHEYWTLSSYRWRSESCSRAGLD